ncbi:MAG: hypothetical protein ACOC2G_01950, partial [Bacillota bacterium]
SVRSAMEMYWADNAEYPDYSIDSWDDLDNELDTVELPELDDLDNFSYEDPNAGDDDEGKEYKIETTNDSTGTTFTITQDEVEDDS